MVGREEGRGSVGLGNCRRRPHYNIRTSSVEFYSKLPVVRMERACSMFFPQASG